MERFWDKVEKSDGCWEWTASKNQWGYGQFYYAGTMRRAHRVAWMLRRSSIPEGMCVLHRCDNNGCVRLSHLFLGTNQDNTDDMLQKARHSHGETHYNAKLTDAEVAEIRTSTVGARIFVERLGISSSTVCDIRKGRTHRI